MRSRSVFVLRRGLLLAALLSSTASGASAQSLHEQALDHWIERDARLQQMTQRILEAGVEFCGDDVAPSLGAAALDLEGLPEALHSVAKARFGKASRFVVTKVFAGGAAEQGGLRVGDAIRARNGRELEKLEQLYAPPRGRTRPSAFALTRDGAEMIVSVPRVPACAYPAVIFVADEANAYADGRSVGFTDAYLRLFEEDDLRALVVGHEVAHNILGHPGRVRNRGRIDLWSARRDERHADYYGIYLAAIAGYEPTNETWARFSRLGSLYGFERGTTHPTSHERDLAARETIAEIETKRANSLPLRPETR